MGASPPIDCKLLEIFASVHYGFGRYGASTWMVGPGVDHLGTTVQEIDARLQSWHRRGQREIDDLKEFYTATGYSEWFGETARLHRTWGKLARLILASRGHDADDDAVRLFQASQWGRRHSDVCLVQLLAANPGTTPWTLSDCPSPFLATPSAFVDRYLKRRAVHIAATIKRYRPRLVIFFDKTHKQEWQQIAGTSFQPTRVPSCLSARTKNTRFLILKHPESVGTTNAYFEDAGVLSAELLAP